MNESNDKIKILETALSLACRELLKRHIFIPTGLNSYEFYFEELAKEKLKNEN